MTRIFVIIFLLAFSHDACCQTAAFGTARYATPVLNSPDFGAIFGGADGTTLKTDRCGQVRELEFIALPGTLFKIIEELKHVELKIYRVETAEYPAPAGVRLYVDHRFLETSSVAPPDRTIGMPSRGNIIAALKMGVGSPYVWGGNAQNGIPELMGWYFVNKASTDDARLKLAGLDCSGLLYQATGGLTPRNTSQLVHFGQPVAIKGKNAAEISRKLEPLDLIVWNGHVLIVLDSDTVIESRLECGVKGNGGVSMTPLLKRLREIMRNRAPSDNWPTAEKQRDIFVVRRWYGL